MIEPIIKYLSSIHEVSTELKEALEQNVRIKTYPANTNILKPGQIANNACYILSGLVRSYYIKDSDEEVTTKFLPENTIITSIFSFYSRKPGNEYITTIEETTIACFHYDNIQKLFKNFHEFNFIMRVVTERYLFFLEIEVYNLRKQSAEDKYAFFEKHFTQLLQRVPQKYIASYLGITTETLSRVRSKKRKIINHPSP